MNDHGFIVPALDGPITGGTLYNGRLIAALRARGVTCGVQTMAELDQAPSPAQPGAMVWLDSLYLEQLVQVRARLEPGQRVGLLMHWFGSAHADAALHTVDLCLAPSTTLRAQLQRLQPGLCCLCVEPGVETRAKLGAASTARSLDALLIANLTANKGVLVFLQRLAGLARAQDTFTLSIVGDPGLDPAYASACHALVGDQPQLRARVAWLGAQTHAATLARLASSQLLVSASLGESYGMALSEARAAGVPILARAGGHVAAHIAAANGGELVSDAHALASSFLALARDSRLVAERGSLARRAPYQRSWDDAARDFTTQFAQLAPTVTQTATAGP